MALSDPAVIAALISGFISLISAIVSHWYLRIRTEKFDRQIKKENWYRNVNYSAQTLIEYSISPTRDPELVIESGKINYDESSNDVLQMKQEVDKLNERKNKSPKMVNNKEIFREIDKMVSYFENPTIGAEQIDSYIDLTDVIYDSAHNIKESASEELN